MYHCSSTASDHMWRSGEGGSNDSKYDWWLKMNRQLAT